eukprot:NODE_106_length_19060_cov_0.700227.p6 type:complete len:403 gc:universal NODE_106_length_19060_cov_0.700227:10019-8811(-)
MSSQPKFKKSKKLKISLESSSVEENAAQPIDSISSALTNLSTSATPLQHQDFKLVKELGHGSGGVVSLVKKGEVIMARKVISMTNEINEKHVIRELNILHSVKFTHIIDFYGGYIYDNQVYLCIEYMNLGSLDGILKLSLTNTKKGLQEGILNSLSVSVLLGLVYLYDNFKIMHRDIKPSNLLLNSDGYFKLCDFGVSGEAVNSIANTFVGTSLYMAPERIQGKEYASQADSWSLGLMVIELFTGTVPFQTSPPMSVFELIQVIIHEDILKTLQPFQKSATSTETLMFDFLDKSLQKQPKDRWNPKQLLRHPWVKGKGTDFLFRGKRNRERFCKINTKLERKVNTSTIYSTSIRNPSSSYKRPCFAVSCFGAISSFSLICSKCPLSSTLDMTIDPKHRRMKI